MFGLKSIYRAFRRRGQWESDMDDELRSHIEHRIDDLIRTGMTPEEAHRRARLEFGARETYQEQCREAHGLRWPDEVRQDLRYALRTFRRSPAFTLVALISLALGIGANTVVFSVVNALILAPLPVRSPDELRFVQRKGPTVSFPNYLDLRDRNITFAGLVGYRIAPMGLDNGSGAFRVWGYLATGNYFDVLGVQPALGRFFRPDEERTPGATPLAVVSHACWHARFGGDPQVLGRTIRINSLPYTIIGVAPRGFRGTELFYVPEIWVPMMMQPQIEGNSWLNDRGTGNTWVLGRLKPGITPQQAEANLNAIAVDLARDYPANNEGLKFKLTKPGLVGDAGRSGVEAFLGGVMALAGLVLLAACANLASQFAARASDRFRELAIRVSIGAGRGRILRQLLTEAVLLSLAGGALGCGLAVVLLGALSQWRMPTDFPVQFDVYPDQTAFAFAFAMSLLTGILFGAAPAWQACRVDPNDALKGAASGKVRSRRWAIRDLLLPAQVALCCLLVFACLVSVRGLVRAVNTPVGFDPKGVAIAGFDVGLAGYSQKVGRNFQRRALEAAAAMPCVDAAAYASSLPLSIDQSSTSVFREGTTEFRPSSATYVSYYDVSPGYFRTMGTRLLAGREFTWRDAAGAALVVIVNETLARQVTGTRDAVGRRVLLGRDRPAEIIGVVEDGKYVSLTEAPRSALFRPALQRYDSTSVLLVRSSLPESQMVMQMRQAIATLDPRLPVYGAGSVTQMLGFVLFPARAATIALTAFGVLAIMLAVTGIYGLAAYGVSRRVREIGVRVAVGARPSQVVWFVLGRTAVLLCVGSAIGLALGAAAAQLLSSVVYGATASDPVVLVGVVVAMAVIGFTATWPPARRALSIDPVRALRHD